MTIPEGEAAPHELDIIEAKDLPPVLHIYGTHEDGRIFQLAEAIDPRKVIAAPAMYEALRNQCKWVERIIDGAWLGPDMASQAFKGCLKDSYLAAYAVLAQAEGRTP